MDKKTKRCSKCGIEKPLDEFTCNNKAKDGKNYSCRECNAKYHQKRYKEYHEEILARARYRYKNDMEVKRKCQEYRDAHKEETKKYNKMYRQSEIGIQKHREESRRNTKRRRSNDPNYKEKKNKWDKNYRKRHKKRIKQKRKTEVALLTDNYVKNKLCGYFNFHGIKCKRDALTSDMVQKWREYLLISRMLLAKRKAS